MTTHVLLPGALDDRMAFVGVTGSGKTYAAKGMVELLLDLKARVCIVDPLGVWWGLRSAFPVAIFGGEHADIPIGESTGAPLAELVAQSTTACVIDLSTLPSQAARRRFMTAFAERLYDRNREPLHLVLDEADLWAPQRPMPDQTILFHRIDEIVRRGRVRGFIPWMITQRPAVLHKDVLSQIDALVALKLVSPQDRNALKAWIEGQADREEGKAVLAHLPKLGQGEGYIWAPVRGVLTLTRFPALRSYDSSRTPKRGETVRGPSLLPIDLDAARVILADAMREETDPKARRRKPVAHAEPLPSKPKVIEVTKQEADALRAENARLKETIKGLERRLDAFTLRPGSVAVGEPPAHGPAISATPVDMEAIYAEVKRRLSEEAPALLRVAAERPELLVEVERKTVQIDGASLKGRIARLIANNFFDEGKTQGAARSELKRTGSDVNQGNLWRALNDFVKDGFLTSESGSEYRAVSGMKINIVER